MIKYSSIFYKCGIFNIDVQIFLTEFVDTGDIDELNAQKLNSEKSYQDFVEEVFAVRFKPLQQLFKGC